MKKVITSLSLTFLLFASSPLYADLHPIKGPATGKLGDMAEIKIPEGYVFLAKDDMKEFMEKSHNLYSGQELGVLVDPNKSSGFLAFFFFDDIGYIQDAAKEKLDPDAMWKEMLDNEKSANEERRKNGWEEIHMVKWAEIPQYNAQTQRLEWAQILEAKGHQFVNYNTRILGRKGVMRVTVVPQSHEWETVLPVFNTAIGGFAFNTGNRYAEWVKGDKVAEIGLAALVVGGAGALAAKTGLLGKLWAVIALVVAKGIKLIVVAAVAVGAFFKKLFGGGKGPGPKDDGTGNPPSSVVKE